MRTNATHAMHATRAREYVVGSMVHPTSCHVGQSASLEAASLGHITLGKLGKHGLRRLTSEDHPLAPSSRAPEEVVAPFVAPSLDMNAMCVCFFVS